MTSLQWLVLIGIAVTLLFTWLLLIDAVARGRLNAKMHHLDAAYRRFSTSDVQPGRNRRLRLKLLVLAVLVILTVICLAILLSRAPGERAVESDTAQSATPGRPSSSGPPPSRSTPRSGSAEGDAIQLEDSADSAAPFQPVRIQGTYRGGANTLLRVQRREGAKWVAFPLPTKTDQSGQFSTYVELGEPGRYQLRVLDANSGVTSKTFVLVIKG
jgi:hypothetical protein